MVCKNCGKVFPDTMLQCTMCGTKVEQNNQFEQFDQGGQQQQNYVNNGSYGTNQNQQNQQSYGNNGNWNNNQFNQPVTVGNSPEFILFIVLGAVYSLCCCNFIIGIPALIFTILMNNAFKAGRQSDYMSNRKIAKMLYICGVVLWVLGVIFGMLGGLFEVIIGAMGM